MGAASAVSTVTARLEYLMRAAVPAVTEREEDIMQIRSELTGVQRLVIAVDAYKGLTSRRLMKEVIQTVYDIEDTIESFVRVRQETVGKPCGCLWNFLSGRSLKDELSVLQRKIKEVKSQISRLLSDKRSLGVAELGTEENNNYSSGSASSIISSCVTPPVVGLADDVEELMMPLLSETDHCLSVIVICGTGGIGKTTLARLLFDQHSVKERFYFRVLVHAGVDFHARGVLEYILSNIVYPDGSREKIKEMEGMELTDGIYKAFHRKRYLVVLDDVRSLDDWETIRFAFPDDDNGSRVIITTRLENVSDDAALYKYEMRPLTLDVSWELTKTLLARRDLDMKARETGQKIIKHCRGVPLAIVLCSNLLGQVKKLEDWEVLLQQVERDQNDQKKSENVLDFIYSLLPVHLKPCFLYLGHFPTDHEILIEKLLLLWMAEGFLSTEGMPNVSKFAIAENYFKALVKRSMVMIQEEEVPATGWSKSCQIHDLVRDLCITIAKEEEYFRVVDFGRTNEESFASHRLAIYLNMHDYVDRVSLNVPEAKNVRSLLFFETNRHQTKPNSRQIEVGDLKEFRWTRVLDFYGIDFRVKKLPKNIKKLVYLRYLSFRGCYLLEFPSSFGNLSFLETLDLLIRESCRITISNVLCNLKRLRHLFLPVVFQIDSKAHDHKLKLNGLTELEILHNFHAASCDANDLEKLENVKSFTGIVDGNNDDLAKIVKRLKYWKIISSWQSSLVVKNFGCYSKKRFSIVEDLLTSCKAPVLEIEGRLPQLPSYTLFSPNITEMVFNGSEFVEDPMQILGNLSNLRRLELRNNAVVGPEMVCSKLAFPRLNFLKLLMLPSLKEWAVNSGAMPKLALLTIEQCKVLQMLPDELMQIETLKEIKIGSMPQIFQQNVRRMAKKQRACTREVLITVYDC